ncbi:MAG: ACT domain-containing protein [Pseudomonadales bacterium]|nr:ACT domain-containing protein [Pseudomonadales bacterium]
MVAPIRLRVEPGTFTYFRFDDRASLSRAIAQSDVDPMMVIAWGRDLGVMVPQGTSMENAAGMQEGWQCLASTEAMAFDVVGVAADVTRCIAQSGTSVLVMSGYSHDYFFVMGELAPVVSALREAGHTVEPAP